MCLDLPRGIYPGINPSGHQTHRNLSRAKTAVSPESPALQRKTLESRITLPSELGRRIAVLHGEKAKSSGKDTWEGGGGERTSASHGAKSACEREGGSPGVLLPHSFWKHGLCLPEESFQPPGEGADGPSRLCAGRGGARELSVPAECRVPRAGGDNSRTPASLSRRHFNASLPPRTPGLWCPRGPGDGSELNSGFLGGRGRLPGSATPPLPHSPSLSCLESEGLSSKVWDG